MERTLLIRHNWHDRDEAKWLFWLEKKLVELGFTVSVEALSEAAQKNTEVVVQDIQRTYGIESRNIITVPHDPGSLTLLKYCEQLLRKNTMDSTMLIAGVPKHSYERSASILKMLGGAKGLAVREGDAAYDQNYDPELQLTLQTMDIKLIVIYGGQLVKALPQRE